MTARYPVLLDLHEAPCLVVGGGVVAARKVRGLLAVGATVTVLAPVLEPSLAELVDAGRVTHHAARFAVGGAAPRAGAAPWRFVVAATDDAAVNAAVVAEASASGTWANDVTAADGGPAALPAVARRGPVTVAVATGGAHPGAAAWLRDLAAEVVRPEHVTALELVAELRSAGAPGPVDLPAVGGGRTAQRPDWRELVDSGMLDLIRAGHTAEAKERLQACLSSSSD